MARAKTLSADTLEALGTSKLACLLMEIAEADAKVAKRLRLALAAAEGPEAVARQVRKRVSALKRSSRFLDWRQTGPLARELGDLVDVITGDIAPSAPGLALELAWEFLALAEPTYERCDDSNGSLGGQFADMIKAMGEIAESAQPDPVELAGRVFAALRDNDYGQYDRLIATLGPTLGETGLSRLKALVEAFAETPVELPPEEAREVIGWSPQGPLYRHALEASGRDSLVRMALADIADARGDVEAYVATLSPEARTMPQVALDLARRYLAADRSEEALAALDIVPPDRRIFASSQFDEMKIDLLERLGRTDEAQELRWAAFETRLAAGPLRAYLKRLPDFEDFEAEEKALAYAGAFSSAHAALSFLCGWPSLRKAAALVEARLAEIDGEDFVRLPAAAEALEASEPLAATLVRRKLVDFALEAARSRRYRYAARHVLECAGLSGAINDWKGHPDHDTWVSGLRASHARKSGFWKHLD